jgi:hypothetical protein
MMDRRTFIGALSGGLLAAPLAAEAQQAGKVARIALLTTTSPESSPLIDAFRVGRYASRSRVESRCP